MIIDATVSGLSVADTGTGSGRRRRRPALSPMLSSPAARTIAAAVVPGIAAASPPAAAAAVALRAIANLTTASSLPARPQEGLESRESFAPRLPRLRSCRFSLPINDAVIIAVALFFPFQIFRPQLLLPGLLGIVAPPPPPGCWAAVVCAETRRCGGVGGVGVWTVAMVNGDDVLLSEEGEKTLVLPPSQASLPG